MWRAVVVTWSDLPDARRARLQATMDEALATVEGDGHVVVDERCPGLSTEMVRQLVEQAGDGRPRLGVRPVTDTVKRLRDGVVVGTVDRAGLVQLASPLVVPEACGEPDGDSIAAMVALIGEVELVEVPAVGRRLGDVDELGVLEG